MKKITLVFIASLILFGKVHSQTTSIENPTYGYSNASMLTIKKIERTDTSTTLYCQVKLSSGNWISIPGKTYIQPVEGGEKLFIKGTEGIPMNQKYKMPASGEVSYKLIFQKIDEQVKTIDYGEANKGGNWNIYDIQVKPDLHSSLIPQVLLGNWFNTTNGDWELSLLNNVAVYKNKIWNYDGTKLKKGSGSIHLKNKTTTIELFMQSDKNGYCNFGESPLTRTTYCRDLSKQAISRPITDKPYEAPVFTPDSATYSGYIKGYTPRIGVKTMSVSIDDIITGEQNSFLVNISSDGFFSATLPLYYPHLVFVRSALYNGSVFLEPGKETFQMIGPSDTNDGILFMGEVGKINTDLLQLQKINSYNYYEVQKLILDMSPARYKAYCMDLQQKDMNTLDSIMKTNTISAKAYQIQKMDLEYRSMCNIMEYGWRVESAYREKNNIPREQRTLPIKIDSLTGEYYNFITNENANNPLAVLGSAYNSYINRLKYLDILRIYQHLSYTTLGLADELQKTGYVFTEVERGMIEIVKEQESTMFQIKRKEFYQKYQKRSDKFFKKNPASYPKAKESINSIFILEKYFNEKGVKLTGNDKQMFEKIKAHAMNQDLVEQFHTKHGSGVIAGKTIIARTKNLQKILHVQAGFATDIMTAQDECRKIVSEMTPASDDEIRKTQQQISTPFIAEYVALCNQQTKAKIESNKSQKGYVVNEVPQAQADQVFDGIMKKYKGKVVYVDFWATWCGPCRSGIQQIAPLKEEMANENVAFVYITDQTSPENTWTNMIPTIKGEHYRVSADEWNYLSAKFNISGIPHYVLVGKSGEVLNAKLGFMDNSSLKSELKKHLVE